MPVYSIYLTRKRPFQHPEAGALRRFPAFPHSCTPAANTRWGTGSCDPTPWLDVPSQCFLACSTSCTRTCPSRRPDEEREARATQKTRQSPCAAEGRSQSVRARTYITVRTCAEPMLWPSRLPHARTSLFHCAATPSPRPHRKPTEPIHTSTTAPALSLKLKGGGPAALAIGRIAGVHGQHHPTRHHHAAAACLSSPWRLASLAQRAGGCCNPCDPLRYQAVHGPGGARARRGRGQR